MTRKTWSDEWKRTNPDIIVYLPEKEVAFDSVNQHFCVVRTPRDAWLAIWTRGADEGEPNQSVVASRSTDHGNTWSEPVVIDGPPSAADNGFLPPDRRTGEWKTADVTPDEDARHAGIASWGFPVVAPALDRIYCFYQKNEGVAEYRYDLCGVLRGKWSNDDGLTWSDDHIDLPIRRTAIDHPEPAIPINWIIWQVPYLTSRQEVVAPFTRWPSRRAPEPNGAECWFLRFDNVLTETDPRALATTTLPKGDRGLRFPTYDEPSISFAEEPALVELSDGRLFTAFRTAVGYIAFSISQDRGRSWTAPAPLYRDREGELVLNPVTPAPIYKLADGRFVLLYTNNKGDAHGGHFPCGYACFRTNRYPAFISVGVENPDDPGYPIRFGPPRVFVDSHGVGIGPGGRTDAASYTSLLECNDGRILFYPDRKHFLVGKHVTDEWLKAGEP